MTKTLVQLGDLAVRGGGSVDPKKHPDEVFQLFSIPAFDAGSAEIVTGSEIGSSKKVVQPNDVMLSRIVPHIRRAWVVGPERGHRQIASGEWIIFRSTKIWPAYLRWVLVGDVFHAAFMQTVSGVGGSLLRARPAEVFKIQIPLPSLPAQKRIAAILDAADALRAKRRESIEQLDSLVQARFLEMFGDPVTNPKGWSLAQLGKACIKITDGTHHSPPTLSEGVPYITAKHIKQNRVCFFDDPWFVDTKHHAEIYARCDPRLGDVLYIKDGATTGIAAVNRYEFPFSMLSSVALLRTDPIRLHAEFLAAWLNAPMTKKTLLGYMGGAAIRRLTLAKIKSFEVPLPPLALQTRFASIVVSIEQQKARMKAHLAELDTLFASLQSRAFNGELVA